MNSSDIDTDVSEETQSMTPIQHRVHVMFAHSLKNDELLPTIHTTLVETEPYFNVSITEDAVTKNFYRNQSQINPKKHEDMGSIKQRTLSEPDSLEDENASKLVDKTEKFRETNERINVDGRQSTAPLLKSILKKSEKQKEEVSTPRPPSVSSSKKKQKLSEGLDPNEVLHLAELTAKQKPTSNRMCLRSMFDQTVDIFDPNRRSYMQSNDQNSFRSQFYIRPYREKPIIPSTNMNQQRSRSLSQNRLGQKAEDTAHSNNSSSQSRPLTRQAIRKHHVSWSPVREYIHQGRDKTGRIIGTKRKQKPTEAAKSSILKTSSSAPVSKPDQEISPSITPVPTVNEGPEPCPISSRLSSIDSFYTPSASELSLTTVTSMSQESCNKTEEEEVSKPQLPPVGSQRRKLHDETMDRYDRLLEKMRATDEQLKSLRQSWVSNKQPKSPVKPDRGTNFALNRTTQNSTFFSPVMLQMCLFILVLINLLVVYFFNEINAWWSQSVDPTITIQQHNEGAFNF